MSAELGRLFQSTHSLRSATNRRKTTSYLFSSFNPRTPCGVRQYLDNPGPEDIQFQSTHSLRSATKVFRPVGGKNPVSIHALLAECDGNILTWCSWTNGFQSTHSLRSATIMRVATFLFMRVSIHALLAECDKLSSSASAPINCFNPRTPCGVRRAVPSGQSSSMKFQSTHSLRSATSCQSERISTPGVSIHALLAECDRRPPYLSAPAPGFNPRTPCGVRLHYDALYLMHAGFQSTHSLRSATGQHRRTGRNGRSFNPRTPCGVRQIIDAVQKLCPDVSIHALLAECDKIMINYIHQREGFNPRTPCGVRQDTSGGAWSTMSFNPRTPCGVRQEAIRHLGLTEDVSIHALLAECDSPGSSAGGAGTVSIHALLAECDLRISL